MKTAIVYASVHHGNTKKIIDEIAKTNDVELIDAIQTVEKDLSELSGQITNLFPINCKSKRQLKN